MTERILNAGSKTVMLITLHEKKLEQSADNIKPKNIDTDEIVGMCGLWKTKKL